VPRPRPESIGRALADAELTEDDVEDVVGADHADQLSEGVGSMTDMDRRDAHRQRICRESLFECLELPNRCRGGRAVSCPRQTRCVVAC
jgi:hypothetical protein